MENEKVSSIVQELRKITEFADLPEDQLLWFASQGKEVRAEPGEILWTEGSPANVLSVLLEGEVRIQRDADSTDTRIYTLEPGDIGGKLPYSRMTNFPFSGRAVAPSRIFLFSTDLFPEMIVRMPRLIERLVANMTDRVRFATREDQQREKLIALGKFSAGLAHELNNPAAAAMRAALMLSEAQDALREATAKLDAQALTPEQRKAITQFERQALQHAQAAASLDALASIEQEEEVTAWLKKQKVPNPWKFAPILVEASIDTDWLDSVFQKIGAGVFHDALSRIVAQISAKRLLNEIETSTGRISELVKAIKEYTFMDQAPIQEVDIHDGIESTLVVLRYKLKKGIQLERNYASDLPRIRVFGSALNQVWTNLIDNAADAMNGKGNLRISTSLEGERILVEIEDTGPGIPEEIQGHIFEPFFTTKKMGEGTGLGLDTVSRIVRKHRGSVRVDSRPGSTKFQVRLPVSPDPTTAT